MAPADWIRGKITFFLGQVAQRDVGFYWTNGCGLQRVCSGGPYMVVTAGGARLYGGFGYGDVVSVRRRPAKEKVQEVSILRRLEGT